jgi:hypothetical protein
MRDDNQLFFQNSAGDTLSCSFITLGAFGLFIRLCDHSNRRLGLRGRHDRCDPNQELILPSAPAAENSLPRTFFSSWTSKRRGTPADLEVWPLRAAARERSGDRGGKSSAPFGIGRQRRRRSASSVTSFCQRKHLFSQRFNLNDRACTVGCVRAGAAFVPVTDTRIYQIRIRSCPHSPPLPTSA